MNNFEVNENFESSSLDQAVDFNHLPSYSLELNFKKEFLISQKSVYKKLEKVRLRTFP